MRILFGLSSPSLSSARRNFTLVQEATKLLSERTKPPSLSETNRKLKDVVKHRSNPAKKLFALGTALLIMPDPITDAAAVPVLIAAKVFQSKQSSNVKDVYTELRQAMNSISSLSQL